MSVDYSLSHVQAHTIDTLTCDMIEEFIDVGCWIDVLCDEEFDAIKCRKQQYEGKKVIVYDDLIFI